MKFPDLTPICLQALFTSFPNVSSLLSKKYKGETIGNTENLCVFLLEEARVGLVPGDAFGNPECIRISYAASEETLTEAMKRIKAAVEKLV